MATILIGAEMLTGTFYLLAVGIALAFGGIAAWSGAEMPMQLLIAGVLAVVGTMVAHRWRARRSQPPPQARLDIGQSVRVQTWHADGTARVDYRGTQWNASRRIGTKRRASRRCTLSRRAGRRSCSATSGAERFVITSARDAPPGRSVMQPGFSLVTFAIFIVVLIGVVKAIRVVPQQHAWVVERLGRFHGALAPGLNFVVPFVDRIAYKHDLRETPLDVAPQVCITKDNTQLHVDGILYFQVTDPRLASYGSTNYILAITQLAQTTLRSVIGRMELDRTFEERDQINTAVVAALDAAAPNWGVKVLRYEIKDLTPPAEILRAMQAQITAEREKRAVIATSEGRRQEQINVAQGAREAAIAKSEGEKQAEINNAQGQAAAILAIAEANAKAIRQVAEAIAGPGGIGAVNLKVAEQYIAQFGNLAKTTNTVILPTNVADVAGLIATAMSVLKSAPAAAIDVQRPNGPSRQCIPGHRWRIRPGRGVGANGRRGGRPRRHRGSEGRRG